MGEFCEVGCFVCGKELREVADGITTNQPTDGVMFTTGGNYGSRKFDAFDGSRLLILICDTCLMQSSKRNKVLIYQNQRPVDLFPMGIVGWERVDRPYLIWNGEHSYRGEDDACEIEESDLDSLPKNISLNFTVEQIKQFLRDHEQ